MMDTENNEYQELYARLKPLGLSDAHVKYVYQNNNGLSGWWQQTIAFMIYCVIKLTIVFYFIEYGDYLFIEVSYLDRIAGMDKWYFYHATGYFWILDWGPFILLFFIWPFSQTLLDFMRFSQKQREKLAVGFFIEFHQDTAWENEAEALKRPRGWKKYRAAKYIDDTFLGLPPKKAFLYLARKAKRPFTVLTYLCVIFILCSLVWQYNNYSVITPKGLYQSQLIRSQKFQSWDGVVGRTYCYLSRGRSTYFDRGYDLRFTDGTIAEILRAKPNGELWATLEALDNQVRQLNIPVKAGKYIERECSNRMIRKYGSAPENLRRIMHIEN